MLSNIIDAQIMPSSDFSTAFGDALRDFIDTKKLSQADVAEQIGLDSKSGRARISTYCHIPADGKRPKPSAEILYLLCTKLGFAFEYKGYKISAASMNGHGMLKTKEADEMQLPLPWERQFNLTGNAGTVSVAVKKPSSTVEVSLLLKTKL
jgi:transcriptional regulator with XRE-family HTH domain